LNEVRIIGGKWKRRKLAFPSRAALRPTPNRARETLFNWLARDLDGANCLDLFAGSGALGFEALSRGAASATLVDNDILTVRALQQSRAMLGATHCSIECASALTFLRTCQSVWDIVFLDPPFDSRLLIESLDILAHSSVSLHEHSLVYVETSEHQPADLAQWTIHKTSRAGDVRSMLLLRNLS
jgi:16S rRNA (guanine966-N2)-methyltransferase